MKTPLVHGLGMLDIYLRSEVVLFWLLRPIFMLTMRLITRAGMGQEAFLASNWN